jgi:DHA1 family bicyclomycin/chloramphenicol resistance-like MFS transporter
MTKDIKINKKSTIILGCLIGMAALSIDTSLASIPFMGSELSSDLSTSQFTVGFFMAGVAIGLVPVGLLSDRMGRIPILIYGLITFIIASLMTVVATSIEFMLIARLIQGIGASAGMTIPRAMVRDISSGKSAAQTLSSMMIVLTFIPMLAPIFGSYLVGQFQWRSTFIAITVIGLMLLLSVKKELNETHTGNKSLNVKEQLKTGIKEFFKHKVSIFGMLLVVISITGYMTLITGSSVLMIEIYKLPVGWFGPLFALTGLSVLIGSFINKYLLKKLKIIQVMMIGIFFIGLGASILLTIAYFNEAGFSILWGGVCIYMFGTAFIISNSTAIALDPLSRTAGISASIIGTIQNLCSAIGSVITGLVYNGSISNMIFLMGVFGLLNVVIFVTGVKSIEDSHNTI